YQEQLANRRLMLLAVFNDFPIGHIFIYIRDNDGFGRNQRGYLYSFRVMLPFQNLGIGTELINRAEKVLLHREMAYATIAVARDNAGALRLYKRLDYHIYAEDDGRWTYTNHEGQIVHVHEPCYMLEKRLRA